MSASKKPYFTRTPPKEYDSFLDYTVARYSFREVTPELVKAAMAEYEMYADAEGQTDASEEHLQQARAFLKGLADQYIHLVDADEKPTVCGSIH